MLTPKQPKWIPALLVVFLGLLALCPLPAVEAEVQTGLERVAAGEQAALRGKRLGLIVHAASVTSDGAHAIDVMRKAGLDVVKLLTPEHGLRSRAAAGEFVESGQDPISSLPVVSLYGAKKKPKSEDLEDLDALVFDLQGAGVRFYTYASTLIVTLEAAAEAGLDYVVLDRPNPLGGERVEGPVSAPREVVPESFVNMAPGPLVHGLTLGEMARYVNQRLEKPARLTVIPMRGWDRGMTWKQTGLPWVPPSPNLRSPEAAMAYPGIALIESTNLSEGRGTETPFLVFGAPWLESVPLSSTIAGFDLESTSFTPKGSPAAPRPKHLDELCRGWKVHVGDASTAEPYRLGVTLLELLSRRPEFEWNREGAGLTWLVGTNRLLDDLRSGKTVQAILDADSGDHKAWRIARKEALLYGPESSPPSDSKAR